MLVLPGSDRVPGRGFLGYRSLKQSDKTDG